MKAKLIGLALLGAAMAAPVLAQESGAPAAATASAPVQTAQAQPPKHKGFDENEVVCRSEQVTDSHLGTHRVCMPWKDWLAQEEDVQDQMSQFSRQANPAPGGFGAARH